MGGLRLECTVGIRRAVDMTMGVTLNETVETMGDPDQVDRSVRWKFLPAGPVLVVLDPLPRLRRIVRGNGTGAPTR